MNPQFEEAQRLRNNGQTDEARALYSKVRDEVKGSDPLLAAECMHMIGVSYYQDQSHDKAMESLEGALNEFKALGNKEYQGFVLRDIGLNQFAQKDLIAAQSSLEESVELLTEVGNMGHAGMSMVKLGKLFASTGDFPKALTTIDAGIALLLDANEPFFLSTAWLDRAKVQKESGDIHSAQFSAKTSLTILNTFSSDAEYTERRKELKEFLE